MIRRWRAAGLAAALVLALTATARADALRIAVISDMNGSYGSTDYPPAVAGAIAAIIARGPDLVISTGDMVAGQRASPKLTDAELAAMWAAFHATVSDPLERAGIPLLVTPGNHDASAYPGYEGDRRAFAAAWADRKPDLPLTDAADWPFRIAALIGDVTLVGIDTTRTGPLDGAQMDSLRRTLAAADGGGPVILFGHLPLMPLSIGREDDVLDDPALFALAREAGVDLWLSGHHHAFYSGSAGGILFVSQGALGNGPRALIGTADPSPASFTWIEVSDSGAITVSALPAPDFARPLPMESLPPVMGSGPYRLTRSDRTGGD